MNDVTSPDRLSSLHRWQLAWALSWPCFLFDLLLWLVMIGLPRYFDKELTVFIGAALGMLLFAPWIVRRIVRLNFPDFHLVAIRRPGDGVTRALSYREGLSVAWLLSWRTGAVVLGLQGAIFLALWGLRGAPPARSEFLGESFAPGFTGFIQLVVRNLLSLLLFYLWLISAAIRKTYSGFVLQLRKTDH